MLRAALLFTFIAAATWAQSSNATVHGSASDSTKAMIPGAKVILTGADTGVERRTNTNEAGLFAFPAVIPGPYRISDRVARNAAV